MTIDQKISLWQWSGGQIRGQSLLHGAERLLKHDVVSEKTQAAIDMAFRAEQEFARIRDYEEQIKAIVVATRGLENLGRWLETIEPWERGVEAARRLGNPFKEISTLGFLSTAYRVTGDFGRAVQCAECAWELAEGDGRYVMMTTMALAPLYLAVGLWDRAIQVLDASADEMPVVDPRAAAPMAYLRACALGGLGKTEAALKCFHHAEELARQAGAKGLEAEILGAEGVTLFVHLFALDAAAKALNSSLSIQRALPERVTDIEFALITLGTIEWFRGNLEDALDLTEQGTQLAEKVGNVRVYELGLVRLGTICHSIGEYEQSRRLLEEATRRLEATRLKIGNRDNEKVGFADLNLLAFEQLQSVLMTMGRREQSVEVGERFRARQLADLIDGAHDGNYEPITCEKMAAFAEEIGSTVVEYSHLWRPVLADHEVKIEQHLSIAVFRSNGARFFRHVPIETFTHRIAVLNGDIQAKQVMADILVTPYLNLHPKDPEDRGVWPEEWLRLLHEMLINPIEDLLPSDCNETVVFIPHLDLYTVPFAALMRSDGSYLIDRHTIMTAPSINILLKLRSREATMASKRGAGVLVAGNPKFDPSLDLPNLEGSKREAQEIAEMYHVEALVGAAATKKQILRNAPECEIIHLATHGSLCQPMSGGMPGAIALAPEDGDDGLLWSDELIVQRWNADLVVLSACNTGLGRLSADGILGLSRSLLAAGASTIVVALAPINDRATYELMRAFHEAYQRTSDKAGALRDAMLTVRKKFKEKENWAMVTIMGQRWSGTGRSGCDL